MSSFALLLDWERVYFDPGNTVVTPLDFKSYPISHSLLMSLVSALVFAAVYFGPTRYLLGALVAGVAGGQSLGVGFSDPSAGSALLPTGGPRVGLGLRHHLVATLPIPYPFLPGYSR